MFVGNFKYSIDAKGRVALPAKLRKKVNPQAQDTFYLVRDTEKCIDLYPKDTWDKLVEEKLNTLNQFDPKEAMFLRLFLQESAEDTLDSQSRVTIPKRLIEYAGIERDVLIVGSITKIELWNPDIYEKYVAENFSSYEEIAKDVMKKDG